MDAKNGGVTVDLKMMKTAQVTEGAIFIRVLSMNDFTKDDLLRMKNAIEYQSDLMHYPSKDVDACNQLSHKIQSLIDNYCEHKNTECAGGWTYKCTDCGQMFGDETQ